MARFREKWSKFKALSAFYLFFFDKIRIFFLRVAVLVMTVAVIVYLFVFFINKDKIGFNPNARLVEIKKEFYADINQNKDSQDLLVNLRVTGRRLIWCNLLGEGCTDNPEDAHIYKKDSLVSFLSSVLFAPFYNPPASGIKWAYEGLQGVGIVPRVYAAQGIGYAAMSGIQPLWKLFRDFTFMFFVLVIVICGIMIMFKNKLGGQASVKIESALPKIVFAMILVTFSYAIAGFLIDMLYVSMGLVAVLFSSGEPQMNLCSPDWWERGKGYGEAFTSAIVNNIGDSINYDCRPEITRYELFNNYILGDWSGGIFASMPSFPNMFGTAESIYNFIPETIRYIIDTTASVFLPNIISSYIGLWLPSGRVSTSIRDIGNKVGVTVFLKKIFGSPSTSGDLVSKKLSGAEGFIGTLVENIKNMGLTGSAFKNADWVSLISGLLGFTGSLIVSVFLTRTIAMMLLALVFMLSYVFIFVRIFFSLSMSYVKIILMIIFSPIILAFEALPGKNVFGGWIMGLIGELLTFLLYFVMFLISNVILNLDFESGKTLWVPPLIAPFDSEGFKMVLGALMLFSAPQLVQFVKTTLGIKEGNLPSFSIMSMIAGAGILAAPITAPKMISTMMVSNPWIKSMLGEDRIKNMPIFGEVIYKEMKRQERIKDFTNQISNTSES